MFHCQQSKTIHIIEQTYLLKVNYKFSQFLENINLFYPFIMKNFRSGSQITMSQCLQLNDYFCCNIMLRSTLKIDVITILIS